MILNRLQHALLLRCIVLEYDTCLPFGVRSSVAGNDARLLLGQLAHKSQHVSNCTCNSGFALPFVHKQSCFMSVFVRVFNLFYLSIRFALNCEGLDGGLGKLSGMLSNRPTWGSNNCTFNQLWNVRTCSIKSPTQFLFFSSWIYMDVSLCFPFLLSLVSPHRQNAAFVICWISYNSITLN